MSKSRLVLITAFSSYLGLLEHDEVFVDRLQHRIGDARATVEKCTPQQHHVDEFDKGSAGKPVEEFFLMIPALGKTF